MPEISTDTHYQSVVHATWINNKKKPLDDPRVRRALNLALDHRVLVAAFDRATTELV